MADRKKPAPLNAPLPDTVDLIVLGSGVAGLTAALTATLAGLKCLVLEHAEDLGGTSARSSGSVWIPGNRYIGAADRAEAARYLDALIGKKAPSALRDTLLEHGPKMLDALESGAGVGFRPLSGSVDYRPELPGAAMGSRALEPLPFDGRRLGPAFDRLARPLRELMLFGRLMVSRVEAAQLLRADRSPKAALLGLNIVTRGLADRLRGAPRGTRLVMGNALVARLLDACLTRGVLFRTGVNVSALVQETRHVCGVTVGDKTIVARSGVVLAGGGFPANPEMRVAHQPAPVLPETPAADGCDGSTIRLGLAAGGRLGPASVDNALWFPSSVYTRRDGSRATYPHIVLDRAKPGSVIVGADGTRFANEALPYHYFVRAMYAANVGQSTIPAWMICDRRFIRRYGLGVIRPRTPVLRGYIASGYLKTAPDAAGLAKVLGLPAPALRGTLDKMNRAATSGSDPDFHRGESAYDRALGDPAQAPNPCLGPIGDGPLYAVRLIPTPLGTSLGLVTDTRARVLDETAQPIAGLYACGNDTHAAYGGEYPGAGAQLGLAMTFAWLAGRDAAGADF